MSFTRRREHGEKFLFLFCKCGSGVSGSLHAEHFKDVARIRTQVCSLFDEPVTARALRRACIVRKRKHIASVGKRSFGGDERAALLSCREHKHALRKSRKNAVARMKGALLNARTHGILADKQRSFDDFAL